MGCIVLYYFAPDFAVRDSNKHHKMRLIFYGCVGDAGELVNDGNATTGERSLRGHYMYIYCSLLKILSI